jgi:hypothetical protein
MVGGALDSHEAPAEAALREAAEEAGILGGAVRVIGERVGMDHGDWRYTYVLATVTGPVRAEVLTSESDELRWVGLDDVAALPLHGGLGLSWAALRDGIGTALTGCRPARAGSEGAHGFVQVRGALGGQQRGEDLADLLGLQQEPVVPVGRADDLQRPAPRDPGSDLGA